MKPGERIKELRESRGFTKNLKGFADVIGFSDAYLSEIETGKKNPSLKILFAIEEKFDVSPATILWGLSKDQWDLLKQILQPEGLPGDLFGRLIELLRSPVRDHGYVQISGSPPVFQDTQIPYEKRQEKNASLRGLIDKVIRIIMSGSTKIVTALESNVEAFSENLELKSKIENGGGHYDA